MKLNKELGLESLQGRHMLKILFLPATIYKWNDLDSSLLNARTISVFNQNILNFTHLSPNNVFKIYSPHGLKLLTRFYLDLSHLQGLKFKQNLSDCCDENCMRQKDNKSLNYFILQWILFRK